MLIEPVALKPRREVFSKRFPESGGKQEIKYED
jgi:hypothetical protein